MRTVEPPSWATLPCRERTLAFLEDTKNFYNLHNRGARQGRHRENGWCHYNPSDTSPGCAIGRHMQQPPDFRDWSVGAQAVLSPCVYHLLPQWMKDLLPRHLEMIQRFHDLKAHWSEEGVSAAGQAQYAVIVANIEQFYDKASEACNPAPSDGSERSLVITCFEQVRKIVDPVSTLANPQRTTYGSMIELVDHFKDKPKRPGFVWLFSSRHYMPPYIAINWYALLKDMDTPLKDRVL